MDNSHSVTEEGTSQYIALQTVILIISSSPIQIIDLETKLSEVQKEVVEGGATRKSRLATDWIPRPPERFELTGHRAPVTKVTFHPTYR